MKKYFLLGTVILGVGLILILLTFPMREASALPEYAAQTGEPCATCHISPSGGGPRTPRGQGWIADKKPGAVPDLISSLGLLGVELDIDPADYSRTIEDISPAQPLPLLSAEASILHDHLSDYPGN
jgi:hypothetical protein